MHQHTSGFRSTSTLLKLWLLGLIGSGAICSLLFPANTLAAPTAEWTTPWKFTLGHSTAAGNVTGPLDDTGFAGQKLSGTAAVAKSFSTVSSGSIFPSEAFTEVDFKRSFSLDGSPGGWVVSLDGVLDGTLSVGGLSRNPEARVVALASISGLNQTVAGISFEQTLNTSTINDGFFLEGVVIHHSDERSFPDGNYDVGGALNTDASVNGSFSSPGGATADFFNTEHGSPFEAGFTVSVNATPVPETINLVGAFAVVGFCGYIWFRRSRALRCS